VSHTAACQALWDVLVVGAGPAGAVAAGELARARALHEDAPVHFFVHDALAAPFPGSYDAVICSLFLHHLDEGPAVALLRSMASLPGGGPALLLVNDLDRSLRGLLLAYLATRLLSASPVVHIDGPLSVRAAFTLAEARALAEQAGLHGASVRRRWPCRWLLSWTRHA
jgi:SAM-dependent methyltransferase